MGKSNKSSGSKSRNLVFEVHIMILELKCGHTLNWITVKAEIVTIRTSIIISLLVERKRSTRKLFLTSNLAVDVLALYNIAIVTRSAAALQI